MTSRYGTWYVGPPDAPDKYRLLTRTGSGGEAEVWEADYTLRGERERVAVKILKPTWGDIDEVRPFWEDQVELLRHVRREDVVGPHASFVGATMHGRGEAPIATGQALYLVMEWVDGADLRTWVRQHPGPANQPATFDLLTEIAEILDWLHSGQAVPSSGRPIIHGDISPANIIVRPDGRPVLVDFGLVRLGRDVTGPVAGTPGYVAPEVRYRGVYGPPSDRYAFAGLTHFLFTGEHPPVAEQEAIARLGAELGVPTRKVEVMFATEPQRRPHASDWINDLQIRSTRSVGGGESTRISLPSADLRTLAPASRPPTGMPTFVRGPAGRPDGPPPALSLARLVRSPMAWLGLLALSCGGVPIAYDSWSRFDIGVSVLSITTLAILWWRAAQPDTLDKEKLLRGCVIVLAILAAVAGCGRVFATDDTADGNGGGSTPSRSATVSQSPSPSRRPATTTPAAPTTAATSSVPTASAPAGPQPTTFVIRLPREVSCTWHGAMVWVDIDTQTVWGETAADKDEADIAYGTDCRDRDGGLWGLSTGWLGLPLSSRPDEEKCRLAARSNRADYPTTAAHLDVGSAWCLITNRGNVALLTIGRVEWIDDSDELPAVTFTVTYWATRSG